MENIYQLIKIDTINSGYRLIGYYSSNKNAERAKKIALLTDEFKGKTLTGSYVRSYVIHEIKLDVFPKMEI